MAGEMAKPPENSHFWRKTDVKKILLSMKKMHFLLAKLFFLCQTIFSMPKFLLAWVHFMLHAIVACGMMLARVHLMLVCTGIVCLHKSALYACITLNCMLACTCNICLHSRAFYACMHFAFYACIKMHIVLACVCLHVLASVCVLWHSCHVLFLR